MNKENSAPSGLGEPTGRITRARAAVCRTSGVVIPGRPPIIKSDKKLVLRGKAKRDENNYAAPTAAFQQKKRAALQDMTNACCGNALKGCSNVRKNQVRVSKRLKSGPSEATLCSAKKDSNLAPAASGESALLHETTKDEEIQVVAALDPEETELWKKIPPGSQNVESLMDGDSTCGTDLFEGHNFRGGPEIISQTKLVKSDLCKSSVDLNYIDIDIDHSNPQMCCQYASDIYTNLRAAELLRRPSSDFMVTVQRDITHSMRGILIDWLVEVSDEYKLVPDTLYLTVNIIDRFLSEKYIERQRLQLLGITSMLIASKYEEICAPRVEEFCFITDNTYTKAEVLKMETQILSFLSFQLSVPTIKTFLRRFVRAANTFYKVPPQALSHLANYLAELTLVEYRFLKFLPSVIAASAVFLARWTLEQSESPWNHTLEHYTSYKVSELEATVRAMQELQMNSSNCPLNAIREKYKHSKFDSVAALTSPKLLQSLFC